MRISPISNNYLTQKNNINRMEGNPQITPSLYTEGSDNDSRTKSNDYTTTQKTLITNMMYYHYSMGEVKIKMYNDGSHSFDYLA